MAFLPDCGTFLLEISKGWKGFQGHIEACPPNSFETKTRGMKATDIRKGQLLKHEGRICRVMTSTHITPGKGVACMQVTMKDLEKGTNINHRFRSDNNVERLSVDVQKMEYLYQEGSDYVFMNSETFEQVHLNAELVGDLIHYVLPNSQVDVAFIEERPIYIELPQKVTLKVVETEPGIKNATATNVMKPATMETGVIVQVPPFIDRDQEIIVNTETGEYVGRA